METKEKQLVKRNFLEKKMVRVVPVPAKQKWVTLTSDPMDEKAGFQYTGAKRSLPIPASRHNANLFVKILDDITEYETKYGVMTEKQFFEREIGQPLDFNASNSFWKDFRVPLNKSGFTLNLTNPIDYLRYKALQVMKRHIAPNKAEMYFKGTYWFYLEEEDDYVDEEIQKIRLQDEANTLWNEIKDKPKKLKDVLRVLGRKISPTMADKPDFYMTEVHKFKTDKPKEFIELLKDSNFSAKAFIKEAIQAGSIIRNQNNKFYIAGNDVDIFNSELELMNYLEDPENSATKLRIKSQIDRGK